MTTPSSPRRKRLEERRASAPVKAPPAAAKPDGGDHALESSVDQALAAHRSHALPPGPPDLRELEAGLASRPVPGPAPSARKAKPVSPAPPAAEAEFQEIDHASSRAPETARPGEPHYVQSKALPAKQRPAQPAPQPPQPSAKSAPQPAAQPVEPVPPLAPPAPPPAPAARSQRAEALQARPGARVVPTAAELPHTVTKKGRSLTALPHGGAVSSIPPVPAGHKEMELLTMVPERAWVRILYDEAAHTYLYEVIEPELSDDERTVRAFLHDTLVRTLDGRQGRTADWETVLVDSIRQAISDHSIRITEAGARRLEYYLVRDFLGYGPIDIMMRDPMLEDISCDGPEIPLYLFHRKYESLRSNVKFADELELDSFVIRLAQRSRKHISIADPLLDATLPDGSRLQCTLSREVTTRGSSFTIRKFRADPLSPPDLVRYETLSAEMAGWFWFAMEVGSSFLIAGGTASGKTTTLNAISQFIPPEKKIVSIEDTREINLSHENWIAGVTRSGFGGELVGGKIAGTIDMYKLLEAALRQRPEYLLVGEVRGPEALTLFQAMATGHAVYSTMHADSVQSAVYRLENEPINVPRMMLQTLDIIVIQAQVRLGDKMTRRLLEVTEIVGYEPETKELLTNTVFEWESATNKHRYLGKSYVLEQVMTARNMTEEEVETEWRNRVAVIDWMMRRNVRGVGEVASVVSQYYRNPQALMARIRAEPAEVDKPSAGTGSASAAPEG